MAKEILKDAKAAETAGSKAEAVQGQTKKKEQNLLQESVYTVNELATNGKKVFGARQECVSAALRAAGKAECTVSEAKEIVEKFLKKEVK